VVTRLGWWSFFVLSLGLCLTVVRPLAAAASFTLTPNQRDAAIRLGRQSVISEEFGGEWKVGGDGSGQTLVIVTPFHRLALAARNSAFKSQELTPKDIDALSKDQEGTLTIWATLKGGKGDFARFYAPVLVSGQQEIKATFVQNERTARREDDGSFTARCMYVFPTDKFNAKDTVTLIVKNSDSQLVAKFTVDLSAMR
jgi:hypothetical protein